MTVSTGAIGISPAGEVEVYVPPNVIAVTPPNLGYQVVYGSPTPVGDGQTLPAGTWEIQSGNVISDGTAVVRSVTITPL